MYILFLVSTIIAIWVYSNNWKPVKKVTNEKERTLPTKIYIVNSNFKGHSASKYCPKHVIPFEWIHNTDPRQIPEGSLVVYTDKHVSEALSKHINVAWVLEPGVIDPNPYGKLCDPEIKQLYKKILNFDYAFLNGLEDQGFWVPNAMTWVDPELIPPKKKKFNITFIGSKRKHTLGHRIRHDVVKRFQDDLEIHGSIVDKPFKDKSDILLNSRFHVEVENCKREGYFSEKLIDALLSKCIVLYWGDIKLPSATFNMQSVWCWDTIEELDELIEKACNMTDEEYSLYDTILEENRQTAYEFICPEKFLVEPLTRVWSQKK